MKVQLLWYKNIRYCNMMLRFIIRPLTTLKNNIIKDVKIASSNSFATDSRQLTLPDFNDLPVVVDSESVKNNPDYFFTYIDLINFLTEYEGSSTLGEAKERLPKILKHALPYGRQFEGIGVANTYKLVESPQNLTPENIKLANILSWCTAMQTAVYLIDDDIIDGEKIRYERPCWYMLPGNTTAAVNDSRLVQNAIFAILKKYFSMKTCYTPILDLLNATNYKVALGQSIDISCKVNETPKFEEFTRERYEFLIEYKCIPFAYEFTLRAALLLANVDCTMLEARLRSMLSNLSHLFMMHDDLRDSFCKLDLIGRRSTDICNGRCNWLALEVLERGTHIQKARFKEHYGKRSIESETIIQDLYRELNLPELYKEIEGKLVKSIYEEAKYLADVIPVQVFANFMSDTLEYMHD